VCRAFNANSEYIAWIRNLLDEAEIPWQVATYKVGGGDGTIGVELSDEFIRAGTGNDRIPTG